MIWGYKAVVFDYYFTIVDPGVTTMTTFESMLGTLLPELSVDAFLVARSEYLDTSPEIATARGDAQFATYAEKWRTYGDGLLAHLGAPGSGDHFVAARYAAHAAAPAYVDARPTIESLRSAGVRLGVLSDADAGYLADNIAFNDIKVDVVVSSEELQLYKPDPATFSEVCKRLDVAPSEAVFVGDSPVNDVEGALGAGLTAIWLNRNGAEWPATCARRPAGEIRSLTELADVLRSFVWPAVD